MKKRILWAGMMLLCLALTGCGCKHEYDDGAVTKEPTCTEEGEKTFTCTLCGDTKVESVPTREHSYEEAVTKEPTFEEEGEKTFTCVDCGESYTEPVPVLDDEVVVTVTDKTNLAKDTQAGRYNDRVEFTFEVWNRTDKVVRGIQGILTVCDMFGKEILSVNCDFTGENIAANATIVFDEMGMDINPYIDDNVKLYNTDFSDLIFKYEVTGIVYADGAGQEEEPDTDTPENQDIIVNVIDKQNLEEDYSAGRYSPRVEFTFEVFNHAAKDIKGIQGVFTIKDLFGVEIMKVSLDFTGQNIAANGSAVFTGLGMDINEFMDEHVKIYNTAFDDLQFEYEVTGIVYADGSGMEEEPAMGTLEDQKVVVNVTDKQNLEENYRAGRYSPRVEFTFEVFNHTSKDIKGIQGVFIIKDLFGVEIMTGSLDFTGQNIAANGSAVFTGLGMDVNEFIDEHVKVYNTAYDDLKFEYQVTAIVYTDGTTENF